VFSCNKVDLGTRYLLAEMPPLPSATSAVLDLGCGYGPIALALARRAPDATVWAVDVNERALDLTRENAAANELSNVEVCVPAAVPDELRFDAIVSNPPIRIGKQALHALLGDWLDRLAPHGRAWLVVKKHLRSDSLARWLNVNGWATERLGSRLGYRILEVAPR